MRVPILLSTVLLITVPALATPLRHEPAADKARQADKNDKADKNEKGDKKDKLELTLKATPPISFSPATIRVVAQLTGGPDDAEELYCPTIEWDWGDETHSENAADCDPYQPGVSKITRRFSTSHVFETAGRYRVLLRLKRDTKTLISANTMVQVRPGVRDIGPY